MSKSRRSFSVEQKLQIIQEAEQIGVTQTIRKHNLSHSVYLRWKRQFNESGVNLLKPQYHKVDPELRALQEENARLPGQKLVMSYRKTRKYNLIFGTALETNSRRPKEFLPFKLQDRNIGSMCH